MAKQGKRNKIDLRQNHKTNYLNDILFWLIILMFTLIPILIFNTNVTYISPFITNNADTGVYSDVMYVKFIVLLSTSLALLALYLYKLISNSSEIRFDYTTLPIFIMVLLISLSSALSAYKSISIFGNVQIREGALTYLSFIIVFIITANLEYTESKLKFVDLALYLIVAWNVPLVISDFYGASTGYHSTFGNPDYQSGIGSVISLFFIGRAVLATEKKQQVVYAIFAALSFILVITSLALSGFLTIILMLPLVLITIWFCSNKKQAIANFLVISVLFALVFTVLSLHNNQMWNESVGLITNVKGNAIDTSSTPVSQNAELAEKNEKLPEFNLPPSGWGTATGRLYIWNKTIDLVKAKPILGYGLDTLEYYFPQYDINKISNLYDPIVHTDKVHNLYLSLAYGTGIFTLLALLCLIISHIWFSFKLIKNGITDANLRFIAAGFLAFCTYLIQALVNDPIISGGIIFWTLFGISTSIICNELNRKYTKTETPAANLRAQLPTIKTI